MTKLVWDEVGTRRFEAGVDRGVLYTTGGMGVAWSGLLSVSEDSPGADITQYFIDGIKYLETIGREDFAGTIEAITYPDEFEIHDGTRSLATGLIVKQQSRKRFSFSYRTRVGDDVDQNSNYKIHIVYNAIAAPTSRQYGSLSDSIDPMSFSWSFSTIPKRPNAQGSYAPLAHLIIDSRRTPPVLLRYLEARLYGSVNEPAELIPLDEMFFLFENPITGLSILADPTTGLSRLITETANPADLVGDEEVGLYDNLPESRLTPISAKPGLFKLGPRP